MMLYGSACTGMTEPHKTAIQQTMIRKVIRFSSGRRFTIG
jgi:hypothetical protein